MIPHRVRAVPVIVLLLATAAPLAGQAGCDPGFDPGCVPASPAPRRAGVGEHAATAAVNAALGGLTAGVLRRARGGSFREGFLAGAAGGALVYAGKRVAVERWDGAGLLGRELAAVGASVTWNASSGRGAFDQVMLPVGPVRLYVRADSGLRVTPKLDVAAVVATAVIATRPRTGLDWGESLSSGALVFRRRDPGGELDWEGAQVAGVVVIRERPSFVPHDAGEPTPEDALAHERVHVLQQDQVYLLWGAPLEDALVRGSRRGQAIHRHLDFGADVLLLGVGVAALDYGSRPWEREAYFLSGTREVANWDR
jgi:hypothetical protein